MGLYRHLVSYNDCTIRVQFWLNAIIHLIKWETWGLVCNIMEYLYLIYPIIMDVHYGILLCTLKCGVTPIYICYNIIYCKLFFVFCSEGYFVFHSAKCHNYMSYVRRIADHNTMCFQKTLCWCTQHSTWVLYMFLVSLHHCQYSGNAIFCTY